MKTMGGDLDNKLRSPLSVPLVSLQRRPTVLLVNPLKGDVFRGEQVLLHGSTQVSLVTKYHAVMIFPLNVLEIVDVMHIGCGQIIGTYDTCYATKCMKFVAVVVHVLRSTIAPGWRMLYISLPHRASLGMCILAHLHRLGVNAEYKRSAVNGLYYGLTDILTKQTGQLPALIELPMAN